MRLTDTRKDEAERGITIKSTGISLYMQMSDEDLKGFTGERFRISQVISGRNTALLLFLDTQLAQVCCNGSDVSILIYAAW